VLQKDLLMRIIRKIKQLQQEAAKIKLQNKRIGFVPTMGALHEGHLTLIRRARKENDLVVVSIFVNPVQFGPKEDFKVYPRHLLKDVSLCKKEGADIIFYPDVRQMYPSEFGTYVTVNGLSECLCGKLRPEHFKGVATVVAKLFNIVSADTAYFGQKDAQQSVIIKKLVRDLSMPVEIKVLPIVREIDGLAMSSRNIYLSKKERTQALVLFESLNLARGLVKEGIRDSKKIICSMKQLIQAESLAKIDYVAVVDAENLKPLKKIKDKALIALAVRFGKTRLIDNIIV
jgi:pantoate--beta-alanine ligase